MNVFITAGGRKVRAFWTGWRLWSVAGFVNFFHNELQAMIISLFQFIFTSKSSFVPHHVHFAHVYMSKSLKQNCDLAAYYWKTLRTASCKCFAVLDIKINIYLHEETLVFVSKLPMTSWPFLSSVKIEVSKTFILVNVCWCNFMTEHWNQNIFWINDIHAIVKYAQASENFELFTLEHRANSSRRKQQLCDHLGNVF